MTEQQRQGAASGNAKPGDEAEPGAPGSGDALCPACGGSGRLDGRTCESCNGTGTVTEGIGGA
jgi:DnaJ-class molecular chaperone